MLSLEKILGVDIGGTFTDFVLYDPADGSATVHKRPTTGENPARGLMDGISEICERTGTPVGEIGTILHGTTIATNAILEYDGARAGLVTTNGFRDILHIGRHQRPLHYSIVQDIPWQTRPLVKRRFRKTVTERIAPPKGEVVIPLNEDEVREIAKEFRDVGIESVAVCFLFSYLNPGHEARAKEILQEELPDVFVSTSSELFPQFREFERFTTAAINAFVGPKVSRYLDKLEDSLQKKSMKSRLRVMMSNGGVATAAAAGEKPATLLLSGPAAGILGGKWAGELSERKRLITFDVGGTSADIGIITDLGIVEAPARDTWIGGYPLLVPMLDVHTIGAGGGSIAYIDEGGRFRVGPRSAGAYPGPACYAFGGEEPTVTDANVVLGRIDPSRFLGGEFRLDRSLAEKAVGSLAERLRMPLADAAEGIITLANSNMAGAIRSRTVERGRDPREFTLVAFGGAGPLQAAELADTLDIPEVLIPPFPGITSAMGLVTTDLRYDVMRTVFTLNTEFAFDLVGKDFSELENDLRDRLTQDEVPDPDIQILRSLDCRYVGQGYELRVAVPDGEFDQNMLDHLVEDFHQLHERAYGHSFRGDPVEIVNVRVTAIGITPKMERMRTPERQSLDDALLGEGLSLFRIDGELEETRTQFFDRWKVPLVEEIKGAAILFQRDATILVPPGWIAEVDVTNNLLMTRE